MKGCKIKDKEMNYIEEGRWVEERIEGQLRVKKFSPDLQSRKEKLKFG